MEMCAWRSACLLPGRGRVHSFPWDVTHWDRVLLLSSSYQGLVQVPTSQVHGGCVGPHHQRASSLVMGARAQDKFFRAGRDGNYAG